MTRIPLCRNELELDMRKVHGALAIVALLLAPPPVAAAKDRPLSASGKTQVVAKLNSREITITDLRSEMARLGLSPNDPSAEPAALQSIINRALLADAAREANLHRQPAALRQMATAREQALADLFLASASQPPEPTRAEIEDFIADNPELFSRRRIYTFSVLSLSTDAFDVEERTPLFDESADFAALSAALDEAGVSYSITPAVQPSDAFPLPIRKQLGQYELRDNIVLRGDKTTQIMKITAVKDAAVSGDDAPIAARRVIMAQSAQSRAASLVERLKKDSSLAYYRRSAAPGAVDGSGK
jgi:EpsD family peptidyl-prolyl cis-trans isomerase